MQTNMFQSFCIINVSLCALSIDLKIVTSTQDQFDEFVPSCGPLLVLEYLVYKVETLWAKKSSSVGAGINSH